MEGRKVSSLHDRIWVPTNSVEPRILCDSSARFTPPIAATSLMSSSPLLPNYDNRLFPVYVTKLLTTHNPRITAYIVPVARVCCTSFLVFFFWTWFRGWRTTWFCRCCRWGHDCTWWRGRGCIWRCTWLPWRSTFAWRRTRLGSLRFKNVRISRLIRILKIVLTLENRDICLNSLTAANRCTTAAAVERGIGAILLVVVGAAGVEAELIGVIIRTGVGIAWGRTCCNVINIFYWLAKLTGF